MKRWITLLLAVVLCLGLATPAIAAFPETAAEAATKYAITTTMDEFDNFTEKPLTLHYMYESYVADQYEGYYTIGSDTEITVSNTGTGEDYFVWVRLNVYTKEESGEYAGEYTLRDIETICSLREHGKFYTIVVYDDMDGYLRNAGEDYPNGLRQLSAGESVTIKGSDLVCLERLKGTDSFYEVTIYQYYPQEDGNYRYWYRSRVYKVDDVKAAEIAAAGAAEPEAPVTSGNPFTDVPTDAYYHDAVLWALEKGITTGTTATTFGPDATCTRGQVATFLWRAKGCPEPTTTVNPFTDVKESDYYYKAVLWAYENGITTGATETSFNPGGTCTSAHVVTFLWRANGKPAAEYTGTEYYAEAVAWANANALLEGTATPFAPANLSPRADIVTYLYRDIAE